MISQVMFFWPINIPRALNSTREPASSSVTYFILRAYTGTKKSAEGLEKMQVNGPEGRNKLGRNPWQ